MATNTEIAAKLGLAHSTVSRMRTGARVGSVRTIRRISKEYGIPIEKVMAAADKALNDGDPGDWIKIINGLESAKTEAAS